MSTRQSTISKVHDRVVAAEQHYASIEGKCDSILEFQKKWHMSPLWVALMIIGAFAVGRWLF